MKFRRVWRTAARAPASPRSISASSRLSSWRQSSMRWRGAASLRIRSSDRKSVVQGKSVSVRVDVGGRRIIKKKSNHRQDRYDAVSRKEVPTLQMRDDLLYIGRKH